jgi:CubicO group peptidase (beta-lactamase class C family)
MNAPRSMVISLLLVWLSGACIAAEPETSMGLRRAEGFVAILSQPFDRRVAFVRDNFAPEILARGGPDGLATFLERVRGDIGDKQPLSFIERPDRIILRVQTADGVHRLHLLLTGDAEARIKGILMQPGDDDVALPGPGGAAPPPATAPPSDPTSLPDRIQAAAARFAEGFSGAVIVAKQGQIVHAQAYGQADRGSARANTLDTPFNLASNNKMFTALVIARLVEQGKLGWNDTVGRHLPEWPQAAVRDRVTIAHLLTHTSGLGNYWGEEHDAKRDRLDTVREYADLFRADAPAPQPGQTFAYSNNGYVLLGLIAEAVGGKDYFELVRETVYRPAGMTHADYYRKGDDRHAVAIGYGPGEKANTDELALAGSPAGGGYASANDLLRFAQALQAGRIVRSDTLATMTQGAVPAFPGMRYGYGFGVVSEPVRHFGHLGGSSGVHASFDLYPESEFVVIVLANAEHNAREMTQALNGAVAAAAG